MLHIVAIVGSLVFDFQCISSVNLGPSGEPRENAVGAITFSFPDQIRLIPQCRSWTYKGHLAFCDVDELRQFIQTVLSQKSSDFCQILIRVIQ